MILIINREMMFPNREQYIGNTGDSNSEIRTFRINRLLPGGVDIAHLNFKLDLQYSNEAKDACELRKEVSDEYIVLQWEITPTVLQVPGPIFANVRAYDDVGEVRWSSYKGVFYAEESIDTPGYYEGKLTELEEAEARLSSLEQSVESAKTAAEAAKEAAETAQKEAEEAATEAKKAKEDTNSIGIATTEEAGIVKLDGETMHVEEDGKISVPKATTEKYGIVKPDNETVGFSDDGLLKVLMSGLKVTDVQGVAGKENAEVVLQNFINVIADKVVNQMLTKGMLVNDGTTEEAGKYPLDAAYGKTLFELCSQASKTASPADWTVNDENTAGYVKGRTHWKEVISEYAVILPETTVEFNTELGSLSGLGTDNVTEGVLYNVYWNGTLYECTAFTASKSIFLGNAALSSAGDDTGEPFSIELLTATTSLIMKSTSDAESVTIKVETPESVKYHLLDPKYIPDMFYTEEGKNVEILSETAFTFAGGQWTSETESIPLTSGGTYTVTWDGTVYECVAVEYVEEGTTLGIGVGDMELFNTSGEGSTGEPFLIVYVLPEYVESMGVSNMMACTSDLLNDVESSSHTLSIWGNSGDIVHPLSPKYIPDMYYIETMLISLAEQTYTVNSENMFGLSSLKLIDGVEYTVVWNGVTYKCTCTSGYLQGFGNIGSVMDGTDTGEPFAIFLHPTTGVPTACVLDGSTSVTMSVEAAYEVIHKIDKKYLPELPIDNILDGSAEGSLRTVGSAEESDEYTLGQHAFAEGSGTMATGKYAHSEGWNTVASGNASHAEGTSTNAADENAHAEGRSTTASGYQSHAEGFNTTASGSASHAEGIGCTASKSYAHAEGDYSTASGRAAHAEGEETTASGDCSHSEGFLTEAAGENTHAEGFRTIASVENQHVQGKLNIEDTDGKFAHIVGNGVEESVETSDGNTITVPKRSNAHTLDWEGNAWYAGSVEGTMIIVSSSTEDSTKRFKITVDDDENLVVTNIDTGETTSIGSNATLATIETPGIVKPDGETIKVDEEGKITAEVSPVPSLTSDELTQIGKLCTDYNSNKSSFAFDTETISDDFADTTCFYDGKVRINCNMFAQLIWAGIDFSTFADPDNYDGTIVKNFDWGYSFQFLSRKQAYGLKNSDGSYYGFVQPSSDNYEGSYSYNSYYHPDSTDAYKQVFYPFAFAADMARELHELGCEIPLSEVNVGDLVFFRARDINDGKSDMSERMAYRNINHVAVVSSMNTDGTIKFLIGGDSVSNPIGYIGLSSSSESTRAYMASLLTRVVMCARHPHAFGIESNVGEKFTKIIE